MLYIISIRIVIKGCFPDSLMNKIGHAVQGVMRIFCQLTTGICSLSKISGIVKTERGHFTNGVGDGGDAALRVKAEGDGLVFCIVAADAPIESVINKSVRAHVKKGVSEHIRTFL